MRYLIIFFIVLTQSLHARDVDTQVGSMSLTKIADGFVEPWAVDWLPDHTILVTERGGTLWHIEEGTSKQVTGLPQVFDQGQGGLLDILVPRDFEQTRQIYFSYAKPQRRGAGTALAVGRLSDTGTALEDVRDIFELTPGTRGGRHFGSRIVEGLEGTLYLSIGDRGDRPLAQDLSTEVGSVVRVNKDGSVPADNPFIGQADVRPGIWSYGHRNPQGLAQAPDGTLYAIEHGARGGDEVNLVKRGANYGWPVIAYGRHYSGLPIGEGQAKPGMEQPEFYWDPSMAPSGAVVHSGCGVPEWAGNLFVGSLKFDYIARLDPARGMQEVEQLRFEETLRVRDVIEGPDCGLWFLSVGEGALYRLGPTS